MFRFFAEDKLVCHRIYETRLRDFFLKVTTILLKLRKNFSAISPKYRYSPLFQFLLIDLQMWVFVLRLTFFLCSSIITSRNNSNYFLNFSLTNSFLVFFCISSAESSSMTATMLSIFSEFFFTLNSQKPSDPPFGSHPHSRSSQQLIWDSIEFLVSFFFQKAEQKNRHSIIWIDN